MINDEKKKQIKKDIRDRVIASGVGGGVGYLGGAVYGVGKTHNQYKNEKKKYIKNKMKRRRPSSITEKKFADKFDNMKVPIKKVIKYVDKNQLVPQKKLYNTKMQMEGARLGIKGALMGLPLGVTAYSAYDLNRDNIDKIKRRMKGELKHANKLRSNDR